MSKTPLEVGNLTRNFCSILLQFPQKALQAKLGSSKQVGVLHTKVVQY